MAMSGAGAVPRSSASSVSASSTPCFQSLELLEIVVLNEGAKPCAIAAITARKRSMLSASSVLQRVKISCQSPVFCSTTFTLHNMSTKQHLLRWESRMRAE